MASRRFFIRTAMLGLIACAWVVSAAHSAVGQDADANRPQWIWPVQTAGANQAAYFLREFEVDGQVTTAELGGVADDRMSVFINGQPAGDVQGYQRIARFDVAAHLRQGRNRIAVRGLNDADAAGVLLNLLLSFDDGRRQQIVSDATWRASLAEQPGWSDPDVAVDGWEAAVGFGGLGAPPWGDPTGEVDDYNQWKKSLDAGPATDPATFDIMPGYEVDLLRSALPDEGSWISLAFDPSGRLFVSREKRGILRFTLSNGGADSIKVEVADDTLEECRGLLWAYDSLYANANNSKGLYRLSDTDGDGTLDDVRLLKRTDGGVGHGRNDLALGPDGKIYSIHGNNVRPPADFTPAASPLRNYAKDQLVPCAWDRHLFDADSEPPAGHVVRTDAEGKTWELVAGGFRNAYGLDFNADGELFTFDADMEWDVGAPWYRPTRINHVVSGGDYGWRQGTAMWPAWSAETLPSNLNLGLGSPTAVKFGTASRFPPPYRQALFVLDWSYGRIIAVHLAPQGASYACKAETFIKGRPLNVTDLEFGPDGAMYFIIGGRGTQSGLYRVRYTGPQVDDLPETPTSELIDAREARLLRQTLEHWHGRQDSQAIEAAWPRLGSLDPWIRHAARVAIECQPAEQWQERVLSESSPTAALTSLLALARVGAAELQPRLISRLNYFQVDQLTAEQALTALRAYELCFIRMAPPTGEQSAKIAARLDTAYPAQSALVNQQLCQLLAYLAAPLVVERTLPLVAAAKTQEERMHYLFVLRNVRVGWDADRRGTYFRWLEQAEQFEGAQYMPTFVRNIQQDALAALPEEDRTEFSQLLETKEEIQSTATGVLPPIKRPFVWDWKTTDLADDLLALEQGRDLARGKAVYEQALCVRCHRVGGLGSPVGTDLSVVGGRFNRRDLLEAIVSPSKLVDDKYKSTIVETTGGRLLVGRVVSGDANRLVLATDPADPSVIVEVPLSEIESQTASLVSPMPEDLLNTFTKDEVLDLLAFLHAGSVSTDGKPEAAAP